MANVEPGLTPEEKEELKDLEERIRTARLSFLEIGEALKKISDKRLYRQQFGTFPTYCLAKWGWSDRRAQQLMQAVDVMADLKTRMTDPKKPNHSSLWPATETQVRELAAVDKAEDRPAVWKGALKRAKDDKNRRVTAADVRFVRLKMSPKPEEQPATPPDTNGAAPPDNQPRLTMYTPEEFSKVGPPEVVKAMQAWLQSADDAALDAMEAAIQARRAARGLNVPDEMHEKFTETKEPARV